MVAEHSVDCEHIDPIGLKHFFHVFITDHIALIRRILKLMSFYIVQEHLNSLGTGKLESFTVICEISILKIDDESFRKMIVLPHYRSRLPRNRNA